MMQYAIQWHNGRQINDHGRRIGVFHAFDSAPARDEWVSKTDGMYDTAPGLRDTIDADDDELAQAIAAGEVVEHGAKPRA